MSASPSHGGNEAEIFIIAMLGGTFAILGGNNFFDILGGSKCVSF